MPFLSMRALRDHWRSAKITCLTPYLDVTLWSILLYIEWVNLFELFFSGPEPFYWTIFTDWLPILSTRALLLDNFYWLDAFFVHENRSIGQFLLVGCLFCPWEPFYWTIFTDWLPILSMRTLLLDNFSWLPPHLVHERRSIRQFFLVGCLFCPWEPFY